MNLEPFIAIYTPLYYAFHILMMMYKTTSLYANIHSYHSIQHIQIQFRIFASIDITASTKLY